MSADNWTICPMCVKYTEKDKLAFLDKYKDKIDSFILAKIIKEIDRKIEWIKSYSEEGFEEDEEIIKLIEEREYDIEDSLLCSEEDSCCSVREDYEQGIDDNGKAYVIYEADCQKCDLYRKIRIEGISKEYDYKEVSK